MAGWRGCGLRGLILKDQGIDSFGCVIALKSHHFQKVLEEAQLPDDSG